MACDIRNKGYTVKTDALPPILGQMLWDQSRTPLTTPFKQAGIGRNASHKFDQRVRSDEISWIDNNTPTGTAWISWMAGLQTYLNSRLFLGLFSFESHYALYKPGGFYQRHHDALQGEQNRILSVVIYLNRDWIKSDAGELVLFTDTLENGQILVPPEFGTIVIFLSDEIAHEVLITNKNRYSIAGWFHANRSTATTIDPPS